MERQEAVGTGGFSSSGASANAHISIWNATVGRVFDFGDRFPQLHAELGAGSYRFKLYQPPGFCGPPGSGINCPSSSPWEGHYNIASVVGGLGFGKSLGPHFSVDLTGEESVGKANTQGFGTPTKSHTVPVTLASLAISIH